MGDGPFAPQINDRQIGSDSEELDEQLFE